MAGPADGFQSLVKLSLVGDDAVGKTSLMRRIAVGAPQPGAAGVMPNRIADPIRNAAPVAACVPAPPPRRAKLNSWLLKSLALTSYVGVGRGGGCRETLTACDFGMFRCSVRG